MSDTAFAPSDSASPGAASSLPVAADNATISPSNDAATIKDVSGKLATIDKERIGAVGRAEKSLDANIAATNTIARDQLHATSLMAEKLQPWDSKQKTKEFTTDPITAFGSLGSVLGILASAFTHAPMENALNASAASMNAIRANDKEGYERAHTAWQDNMSLALKRFGLEQAGYKTAMELMATNRQAGQDKLKMEMVKYGWDQGLVMHEAGLDDKLFEAIEARNKAITSANENMPKMVQANAWMSDWHNFGGDSKNPQSPQSVEALRLTNERWGTGTKQTEVQKLMGEYATTAKEDGSYPTLAERTKKYAELQAAQYGGKANSENAIRANRIKEHYQDNLDNGMEDSAAMAEAVKQADKEIPSKSKAKETPAQVYIDKATKEFKDAHDGREPTAAEYQKIVQDAPKPQTTKQFTAQESARLTYTPTLVRSLQVLDAMMDDSTGLFTGAMKQFAAEYIGVNNPVQLWQAAKKEADAAITALAPTGSKSVVALKAQLDTLPETPRASAFGHTQVADKLRSVLDESQSSLSAMEAGGKKLPQDVLDKFAKLGVTIKSDADKNPIAKLNANPQTLTDEELKNLAGLRMAYPKDVQDKIVAEVKRRAADWERTHQKHSELNVPSVASDAMPYPIKLGQRYAMDETVNKGPRSMETQGLQPGGFGGGGAASYRSSPWQPPQVKAELEGVLNDYATGKISSREVQKEFKKRGWSVELRGNKSEAQAFDPNGFGHWLSF